MKKQEWDIIKQLPVKIVKALPKEAVRKEVIENLSEIFKETYKELREVNKKEIGKLSRKVFSYRNRPKVFAIDYDGTLNRAGFRGGKHELDPEIVEFIMLAKKYGHKIVIWTCRSDKYLKEALNVLDRNNIPYDYVNEFPECDFGSPKIVADRYIDDLNLSIKEVKEIVRYERESNSTK
ncbi:MAG: hypothetical protein H0Z24_05620 [Thermosipho sp. (in: Bacteria)]|nr:hypothetical protein [Thermosipho sp. (in: thermotogales)]